MLKTIAVIFVVSILFNNIFHSPIALAGQSAIDRALGKGGKVSLSDQKLMDGLNVHLRDINTWDFISFAQRIRTNPKLKEILKKAEEQEIDIIIGHYSLSDSNSATININNSNNEIIKQIRASVKSARKEKLLKEKIEAPVKELGVVMESISVERFASFIERARANPKLYAALTKAKKQGVGITATYYFLTMWHIIYININQTDESIISYILGK